MTSIIPKPRIVSFTKNNRVISGKVYAIPSTINCLARIIIFPNKGEIPDLYGRLINDLCTRGYDVMFYNRVKTYIDVKDASKEFNRAMKLCIDDIDSNEDRISHKIHVIGQFLAGSEILIGGIDGYFKHRVKSIISINPAFTQFQNGTYKWITSRIQLTDSITTDIYTEYMSSDEEIVKFLKLNDIRYRKIEAFLYRYLFKTIKRLRKRRNLTNFTVKNLYLIQSEEDAYKDTQALREFANGVFIENLQVLQYEKGLTELLIETQEIYDQLAIDLFKWLQDN